jgi:hypothetical protein
MFFTLAGVLGLLVATPRNSIPELHAELLTGTQVNLPADLHGRPTVLVIGFSQGSREEVAAWGKRLTPDYRDVPDVAFYEAAELESVPRLLRPYVVKKIKETVPGPAQAHFLALLDHEAEWKATAHFRAKDEAYVLLIDPSGQVLYTTHGPTSDAAYADLKRRLEPLRSH